VRTLQILLLPTTLTFTSTTGRSSFSGGGVCLTRHGQSRLPEKVTCQTRGIADAQWRFVLLRVQRMLAGSLCMITADTRSDALCRKG
jgi:hypothetical protein